MLLKCADDSFDPRLLEISLRFGFSIVRLCDNTGGQCSTVTVSERWRHSVRGVKWVAWSEEKRGALL